MNEHKDKMNDLLKNFESFIENIHDNYASIQNLERQKQIAESDAGEAINEQIEEIKKILTNNQREASDTLEKVIEFAEGINLSVKEHCKKLQNDFKLNKDNPSLLTIREDITQIKKAI